MRTFKTISRSLFAGLVIAGTVLGASPGQAASPISAATAGVQVDANVIVKVDHRNGRKNEWRDERGGRWQKMGPRQIRRSLRHRGFRAIEILDRRRGAYIVRAVGWRGHPVKLVVDARTAEILRRKPARRWVGWEYRW